MDKLSFNSSKGKEISRRKSLSSKESVKNTQQSSKEAKKDEETMRTSPFAQGSRWGGISRVQSVLRINSVPKKNCQMSEKVGTPRQTESACAACGARPKTFRSLPQALVQDDRNMCAFLSTENERLRAKNTELQRQINTLKEDILRKEKRLLLYANPVNSPRVCQLQYELKPIAPHNRSKSVPSSPRRVRGRNNSYCEKTEMSSFNSKMTDSEQKHNSYASSLSGDTTDLDWYHQELTVVPRGVKYGVGNGIKGGRNQSK